MTILDDVKLDLGLPPDYDVYDPSVQRHINTAIARLVQLGIGPPQGFRLKTGTETWEQFLGATEEFEDAKGYIFQRVKLMFDPPATSFHIAAVEKQLEELAWTLNAKWEVTGWTPPTPS